MIETFCKTHLFVKIRFNYYVFLNKPYISVQILLIHEEDYRFCDQ